MLKLATKFLPAPQDFEKALRAGFPAAEFFTTATVLADWQSVAAMARQYPLDYVIHFPNEGELTPELLQAAVFLHRDLACQEMVIHRGMYEKHAARLLAVEPSLRLAIENGNLDRFAFDRWAAQSRWLTLDVEHLWRYTLDDAPLETLLVAIDAFLAAHCDKLCHVHLPGYRAGGEEHRPLHYGAEMVTRVLSRLARAGFGGLVVSEADLEFQTFDDLRKDVERFEDWRRQFSSLHEADSTVPPDCLAQ